MTHAFPWLRALAGKHRKALRFVLYLYILLIACPIRYWPLEDNTDATWRFALNYAHAKGLIAGVDTVFTSGPLGYLMFPQHIGGNLIQGLLFQLALWIVVAAILADLFFRCGFPLRNLAFFSFWFCLAAPLFWFDYVGQENLILAGVLILIVLFHFQGSWRRYISALVLLGILPLLKLTAGMLGFAALAGFLLDRIFRFHSKAVPAVALALLIPTTVACALYSMVIPSLPAFIKYLHGAIEIVTGFSSAMSTTGPVVDFALALEALALLAFLLTRPSIHGRGTVRFFCLLLALPLCVSFKHGFVRHDQHIISFICFLALALALVSLTVSLNRENAVQSALLMIMFFLMWQYSAWFRIGRLAIIQATGVEAAQMLRGFIPFGGLSKRLDRNIPILPESSRLEPELTRIIGKSTVGPLSFGFVNFAVADFNLELGPVIQRYAAYTPYLDGIDAAWINDKGPQFLVFDGRAIDGRDAWAETPAMWLQVYKWYDTRFLGPRNLLLERRGTPRFTGLETVSRLRTPFPGELRLPVSAEPLFWKMTCDYRLKGKLEKLFFGIPAVTLTAHQTNGFIRIGRILPEVLVSPVMGNYLPASLPQFAAVFARAPYPGYTNDTVRFDGPGVTAFYPTCEVELLRPVLATKK